MTLPAWARSDIARQLLAAIVQAAPELHVGSGRLPRIYGSHRENCVAMPGSALVLLAIGQWSIIIPAVLWAVWS